MPRKPKANTRAAFTSLPDNWEGSRALWQAGKITAREAIRRTGMKRTMFYQLSVNKVCIHSVL